VLPPPTTAARTHLWVAPAHLSRAVALRSRGGGSSADEGDEGEAPATEQCGDDLPATQACYDAPEESEAEGDDAGRPMRVSHARDPPRPTSRSCLSPH